jgi:hypothetical protein
MRSIVSRPTVPWGSLRAVLLAAAAGTFGGCGSDGPELADVTGTVTRDGKPLSGINVEFQPQTGRPSAGRTNDAGEYQLQFTSEQAGALLGQHQVHIVSVPPLPPPDFQGQMTMRVSDVVSVEWPKPVTVERGGNTVNFELSEVEEKKESSPPQRTRQPSPQPLE